MSDSDPEIEQEQIKRKIIDLSDSENDSPDEEDVSEIPLEDQVEEYEEEPSQVALEPFNLTDERDNGEFKQGSFIKSDKNKFDIWLEPVSTGDIAKASKAHSRQTESKEVPTISLEEALISLIRALDSGKNPIECLQLAEDDETINTVSDACTRLISEYPDVYEMDREMMVRAYSKLGSKPYYEFKWPDSPKVHGPFSQNEMRAWLAHDYFHKGVLVRKLGAARFLDISDVEF